MIRDWFIFLLMCVATISITVSLAVWADSCDGDCQARRTQEQIVACTPRLVATSPDGVNLWAIEGSCHNNPSERPVMFSSRSVQSSHMERQGKTTKEVIDETPGEMP